MSRRRSQPWIYRWSRPLIGAIATVGAVLTAYLTIAKLSETDVGCIAGAAVESGGCNDVLNSAYATVFNLPLPLFGLLAYISMVIFALVPLAVNREARRDLRNRLENWTWILLLVGGTAMAVFSGYLMYILAAELKMACAYCIGSALFSLSLLLLTIVGRDWEDLSQLILTAIVVGFVTLISAFGVYANVNNVASAVGNQQPLPAATTRYDLATGTWKITTQSGPAEIALAEHLAAIGAKKYGAFWCPHCYDQKQLFGEKAFGKIDYYECAPEGKDSRTSDCTEAGIKSYPTWEIKGKLYTGAKPLEELARLSDYQGEQDFQYFIPGRQSESQE